MHSLILLSHLAYIFPNSHFPWSFQTKILYKFLIYALRAMCYAHLILPYLIAGKMFGEE
jgi:hypothetical protein